MEQDYTGKTKELYDYVKGKLPLEVSEVSIWISWEESEGVITPNVQVDYKLPTR